MYKLFRNGLYGYLFQVSLLNNEEEVVERLLGYDDHITRNSILGEDVLRKRTTE